MSTFSVRLISRQTKNSPKLYRDSKATSNLFFLMFFALGQLHLYHISKCEIYHWQLKKDFPLQAFYTIWIVLTFQIACHFSAWLEKPRGFYSEVIFCTRCEKSLIQICLPKNDISHLFVTYFLDIVKDGQLKSVLNFCVFLCLTTASEFNMHRNVKYYSILHMYL